MNFAALLLLGYDGRRLFVLSRRGWPMSIRARGLRHRGSKRFCRSRRVDLVLTHWLRGIALAARVFALQTTQHVVLLFLDDRGIAVALEWQMGKRTGLELESGIVRRSRGASDLGVVPFRNLRNLARRSLGKLEPA